MKMPSQERALWLARSILPHEAELRAWLCRRPLAGLDIDDIIQEAYAILSSVDSVEHIRNPRTYFFEVAKSVVLSALRRSRVISFLAVTSVENLDIPCDAPGPDAIAEGRQELERIAVLIAALPPKCRETFTLRKVRGLSQRETARELGISENTVEKHMGKALRILSRFMGDGGNRPAMASKERDGEHAAISTQENRFRN